ncbi:MAG: preprotein translocase subunit SecA [Candidatus Fimimonas sp.]
MKKPVALVGANSPEYQQSFKVTKKQYGGQNSRDLKKLEKIADAVLAKESVYAPLSDEELASQTEVLKQRYQNGETLDQLLPDAFAVCREASWRVLKQKHYYVQILGGIALHQGRICQMATGEGKTLTETLPAYLNALSGKGVHIVTVNEYLACRDAEWMGKVFKFLGLTVGVTLAGSNSQNYYDIVSSKQAAYQCDITYGTNNEFGFDYLRDNMARERSECVQRGLNFVIIDEVDSILIDEARTPLIISGMSGQSNNMYVVANRFVAMLKDSTNVDEEGNVLEGQSDDSDDDDVEIEMQPEEDDAEVDLDKVDVDISQEDLLFNNADVVGEKYDVADEEFGADDRPKPNGDYVVDKKDKIVRLTDKGIKKAEKYFKLKNLSDPENIDLNHYINNALRAHAIMHKDDDYIVEQGEVIIVDSFTGRKMEGRRFSDGLHQAIEAKEHVEIQREDKTQATITFQNFFRLYRKMSGMTGTAKTEEQEFNTIYNIDVVAIPTNKPLIREDLPDAIFATRKGKLKAIVEEIKRRHQTGQPMLIGTVTVEKSEELDRLLNAEKIPHKVLNAKQHKQEAEIVAQAGRLGAVTIATNMAGRGTDILLGGNPEFLAKQEMKKKGFKDEEIEIASGFIKGDEETEKLQQTYAQLLEKHKQITEKEKQQVVEAGGLCVIGTERHESRRIDNQLRGRSGRQGDPGVSMFFVSAEDDMVRIFARDSLQRAMMFLNGDEDTPIQSKMLTRVIESAQKRLEGIHFSSRKSVLQYDDVNNQQRKVIYKERNRILNGEDIHQDILEMVNEYARIVLEKACNGEEDVFKWNLRNVNAVLYSGYFPTPALLDGEETISDVQETLLCYCNEVLDEDEKYASEPQNSPYFGFKEHVVFVYNKRLAAVAKGNGKKTFVKAKTFDRSMLNDYVSIILEPVRQDSKYVSDWDLRRVNAYLANCFPKKPLVTVQNATSARAVCDMLTDICHQILQQRYEFVSEQSSLGVVDDISGITFQDAERYALLNNIDRLWIDHIDALDDLRQGIGLQAIGQHDPLQMYKKEAFDMFEKLNDEIKVRTISDLFFREEIIKYSLVRTRNLRAQSRKKEKPVAEPKAAEVVVEADPNRPLTKQEEYALKRQQRKEEKLKNKK